MRTFAPKQKQSQQTKSPNSARPSRAFAGQSREVSSIPHLQSTIGNQAVQRLLQANGEEHEDTSLTSTSPRFADDFSQIPAHANAYTNMQLKLRVNAPGDKYEQEADRVADQVMQMPEPQLRRACPCGGGCPRCQTKQPGKEHESLQPKRIGSSELGQPASPSIVNKVLALPGQPLDIETRAFFEPRFGRNFSSVRLHNDRQASQSAAEVQARAYTAGRHVVFGAGEYAPRTQVGRSLIAHELAHVVQQHSRAQRQFARKPVTTFETKAIEFTRADIEKVTNNQNYWEQLVFGRYNTSYLNTVSARFKKSTEERDAVLSAVWQSKPATLKGKVTRSVVIPARGAKTKPLLYDFTFEKKGKGEKKDKLSIGFKGEGKQANIIAAPVPAAAYTPPSLSVGSSGFPESIHDYWKKHLDEQKQVYSWIENTAGKTFDQKLTTKTTHKTKERRATFRVEGTKQANKVTKLEVTFLGDHAPQTVTPAAGYDKKEFIDLELEKAQSRKDDKLGTITGLTSVPADELTSVKYTIWQYIDDKTQNAEVDVIVPIANKTKNVFYTLRFQKKARKGKTIDVAVVRVGEQKTSTKLDMKQFSIRRVHGFAANSADVPTLTAWLKKRYPSIAPSGKTIDEVVTSADKDMRSNAHTDSWFRDNYDIHILSGTDGETRLQTKHKYDPLQTADMKSFASDGLHLLEFSLQTMGEPLLTQLKTVRMTRQKVKLDKKNRTIVPDTKHCGLTLTQGADKTIIIFDCGMKKNNFLFVGGTQGVRERGTLLFTHELGHVIEGKNNVRAKFNAFVKKKKIKSPTAYAASNKSKEFFPEAFSLFQNDPEWMQANLPDLFQWFETLSQTGKAP